MPSLALVLPWFVVLILSLSFHEAAHAWTADRLGDETARRLGRLTLNPLAHIDWIGSVLFPLLAIYTGLPLLGWAKPVPVQWSNLREPRRDFALIALAGPVSNLILAVLGALCLFAIGASSALQGATATWLTIVVLVNVLLAVFNLIPVPPLDGGNVLAGFAPEGIARIIDALRPYGFLILYALMFTGVLGAIVGPVRRAIVATLLP